MKMAAVALVLIFGTLSCPSATAEPSTDDLYLAALERSGMTVTNRDAAIAAGHATCLALEEGATPVDVVAKLMSGGYSAEDSGSMLGIAVAAYCPQFRSLIEA